MKKENTLKQNLDLQKRAKKLIKKSKENNLIKPHTAAFKEFPVEKEEHRGSKLSFSKYTSV